MKNTIKTFKKLSEKTNIPTQLINDTEKMRNERFPITPDFYSRLGNKLQNVDFYETPDFNTTVAALKKGFYIDLTDKIDSVNTLQYMTFCNYNLAQAHKIVKKFNSIFDEKFQSTLIKDIPQSKDIIQLSVNEFIALKSVIAPHNDKTVGLPATEGFWAFEQEILTPEILLLSANYLLTNDPNEINVDTLIASISALLNHHKFTADSINELIVENKFDDKVKEIYSFTEFSVNTTTLLTFFTQQLENDKQISLTKKQLAVLKRYPTKTKILTAIEIGKNLKNETIEKYIPVNEFKPAELREIK